MSDELASVLPPNVFVQEDSPDANGRAIAGWMGRWDDRDKNIQHTARYSELSPDRFRDFWKD